MENILGPLIIAVLAVVSVVSQVLESRKKSLEEKERKQRRDALPPEARRKLYGDTENYEIPTAKPKQGAEPPPPPPPPPRRQAPAPKPQPAPQRRQAPQSQRRETPQAPPRRRPAPQSPAPKRRSMREFIPPEARKRVQDTLEEVWRQAQQAADPEMVPERKRVEAPPRRREERPAPPEEQPARTHPVHRHRKPAKAQVKRAKPKHTHPLMRGLLDDREDLRRGILLREILGPPKGLP